MFNQPNSTQLAKLEAVLRQYLPRALEELCHGFTHALGAWRSKAANDQQLQACDDLRILCGQRSQWLRKAVCNAVLRQLQQGGAEPAQLTELEQWVLVDDREVEEMLLARQIVRSLREHIGALEWRICACFNRLAGRQISDADHPLSLEFLLRQVQQQLRLHKSPEDIRQLFLAEALRVLPDALSPYLKQLIASFDQQGVTPLAAPQTLSVTRRPIAPVAVASWEAVRALQRASDTPLPEAPQGLPQMALAQALSALQQAGVPEQGWSSPQLLQSIEAQGCQLSNRQREDTQLIGEIFQGLAKDTRLALGLQNSIQKLMLPLLEAALENSSAIADSQHPMRATLDRVLRLSDRCEPSNPQLEKQLSGLIEQMLSGPGQFNAFDEQLDEMLRVQQRHYDQAAERVRQLYRGRAKLEQARDDVRSALTDLASDQVPKLFLDWLDVGWRDLLVTELIRRGDEDFAWRADLALTRLLARRLFERVAGDEIDEAQVEHLVRLLRRRLDEFSPGSAHGEILQQLGKQLRGLQPVELVASKAVVECAAEVPAELRRWHERVLALHEGEWLHDEQGTALQLVWSNVATDQWVLVDARGREHACYSALTLAELLAKGQMALGQGNSAGLIQRTLQDMVGRLYQEVAHVRNHDDLTGLLNRRSFEGALAQVLARPEPHWYLLLHLDQLSLINSHAGLEGGDACLRQIAERLPLYLPQAECLARFNGVDFALVLPPSDSVQAQQLAEQLRQQLVNEGFVWQHFTHELSLSMGLVEGAPRHDVANLMYDLSSACLQAREAGRNRVHCFDLAQDDSRTGLLAIAARVDGIVEREELSLRVQQIAPTDPQAKGLPHYELLLVMENDLQLGDFIAAAERYQRMGKVDRWVMQRIFAELSQHPELWQHCDGISINLSGNSLNDDRLLGFIESLFERYQVAPHNICFELTETAAVANLAKTADLVRHLQQAGCTFSIDDFGVGFSSFEYLKRLPVDFVKIDGSFVREIERSANDLAMVRSINDIAHALGRQTIAEYVENNAIRARLLEMGVDYVQGFGVAKPRPLNDWLAQTRQHSSLA